MGGARIFAVWGQSQGHKGVKQGMSLGHLAIHGSMWGGGHRGQLCPIPPSTPTSATHAMDFTALKIKL